MKSAFSPGLSFLLFNDIRDHIDTSTNVFTHTYYRFVLLILFIDDKVSLKKEG